MLEREFQSKLIKELKSRFPGSIVLKNDASHIQGIPDLTIFYEDKWATLECKRSEAEYLKETGKRPNQERYVEKMNNMSFSRFIYPENKEEVLDDLQRTLRPER